MKNILITGSSGFIGSNLTQYLCDRDYRVLGVDLQKSRFTNVKNYTHLQTDCRKLTQENLIDIDCVIHLAAKNSVARSFDDPFCFSYNIETFLSVFKLAPGRRFIFASSSSVYGDHVTPPFFETQMGLAKSPYAMSKQVCESYSQQFHHFFGVEYINLRFFNVYGKWQKYDKDYGALLPNLFVAKMKDEFATIYGTGDQRRDFTHVLDICDGIEKAISTRQANTTYNLASGCSHSVNDVATTLKVKTEKAPFRAGDIMHSLADISKAKTLLGYDPRHMILKELEDLYQDFKKNF